MYSLLFFRFNMTLLMKDLETIEHKSFCIKARFRMLFKIIWLPQKYILVFKMLPLELSQIISRAKL